MAASGNVDFAIATEGLEHFSNLLLMPCYQWNRAIIVPKDHPLTQIDRPLSLSELSRVLDRDLRLWFYRPFETRRGI